MGRHSTINKDRWRWNRGGAARRHGDGNNDDANGDSRDDVNFGDVGDGGGGRGWRRWR
jgi:hypothetical protein